MNSSNMAKLLGIGRIGIGVGLIARPKAVTDGWVGRDGATPGGQVLARGLGVRDAVLGVATIATANDPVKRVPVLAAGVVCDLVDASATASAAELPAAKRATTVLIAGGAAVLGAWAAA